MHQDLGADAFQRLAAWLRETIPTFGELQRLDKFPGGQSNPTYRLTFERGACVLRRRPFGPLLPRAHLIEREYRVLSALSGAAFPSPRVFGLCEDAAVIGSAFYVMELVEGRIFWDPRLPELSPAERGGVFDSMNETVAQLHGLDPVALGLEDFGRPTGFMARQIRLWTDQYRGAETRPIPAMEALIDWLPANAPPQEQASRLVHGDLRLDNMIFHPVEPRVIAVLDWELCTLGDPVADLAYHAMTWRIPANLFRGLGGEDLAALGIPNEAQYLAAYLKRTGRESLPHWPFYLAFSFFRVASILQGVAKRAETGNASSAQAVEMGAKAEPLAQLGWEIATCQT